MHSLTSSRLWKLHRTDFAISLCDFHRLLAGKIIEVANMQKELTGWQRLLKEDPQLYLLLDEDELTDEEYQTILDEVDYD